MNKEINDLLASLPPIKAKTKPIEISQKAKTLYFKAHEYWQKKQTPNAVKDHGLTKSKLPVIRNANGLATFCENLFNWSGHHLERTGNTGVFRGGKWTKGTGTQGTSDSKGHYVSKNHTFPIPIYIEYKFQRDKQSDAQKKYQRKVSNTGALYHIVKTPDDVIRFIEYLKTL